MTLTTEQLRSEMIEKIAVASGLRARDGRNVVAEAIYTEVVEPLLAANREAQPVASREHFESLCNHFWNWSEFDEVNAEEEPRLRWDGKNYTHRVTAALWRMYQAAPPAPQSTNAADWGINMQTGTPILTYKNCCVIESEQAHYVLSLINSAATPAPAVPEDIKLAGKENPIIVPGHTSKEGL